VTAPRTGGHAASDRSRPPTGPASDLARTHADTNE